MKIRELVQGLVYVEELNALVFDNKFIINQGLSLESLKTQINEYYEYISDDEKDILYAKSKNIKIFKQKNIPFNFDLVEQVEIEEKIKELKEQYPQYIEEIEDEYEYIKDYEHNILLLKIAFYLKTIFKERNMKRYLMRGSGISSFILYLIGLNKVNPKKFNLDYKNFWKK
jgi:DNA polymerase III alpha subunit